MLRSGVDHSEMWKKEWVVAPTFYQSHSIAPTAYLDLVTIPLATPGTTTGPPIKKVLVEKVEGFILWIPVSSFPVSSTIFAAGIYLSTVTKHASKPDLRLTPIDKNLMEEHQWLWWEVDAYRHQSVTGTPIQQFSLSGSLRMIPRLRRKVWVGPGERLRLTVDCENTACFNVYQFVRTLVSHPS